MARPALLPPEELTRAMVDAALAETRRVMAKRGVTEAGMTYEFMSHAVDRIWTDEGREALRAKGHALVSDYVDRLFDMIDGVRRVV